MFVYLVIPVANNEQTIGPLLEKAEFVLSGSGFLMRYIVIDDGSADKTADVVSSLEPGIPVELWRNKVSFGLGKALAYGLKRAAYLASGDDIVVVMKGDGSQDPAYVFDMVCLLKSGADVISASRFVGATGNPVGMTIKSWFRKLFFRAAMGDQGISDYTCGFIAFKSRVLKALFANHGSDVLLESGPAFPSELLVKMRLLDVTLEEIPFIARPVPGKDGTLEGLRSFFSQAVTLARLRKMALSKPPNDLKRLKSSREFHKNHNKAA